MRTGRNSPVFLALALLVACAGCTTPGKDWVVSSMSVERGERAERSDTMPLELSTGDLLDVELSYGDVRVEAVAGAPPRLEARWQAVAEDQATADAVLARSRLELRRGETSLHVRLDEVELASSGVPGAARRIASLELTFVVPEGVRLLARSSLGDVVASGPFASCHLESSYGDLTATGVRGETRLIASHGDVRVEKILGPRVEATSMGGAVTAIDVQAEQLHLASVFGAVDARHVGGESTLRSRHGHLTIEASAGDLDAETAHGNIVLIAKGKARRKLTTSTGNVHARGAAGELTTRTVSGNVAIEGADGVVGAESRLGVVAIEGRLTRVEATTDSGEIRVRAREESAAHGPWRISSKHGNVRVTLPVFHYDGDFDGELEANAPSGVVESNFFRSDDGKPMQTFARTLGSGGSSVQVSSGTGNVRIDLE